jgi:uncharacterized protein (TIGR03435 family)
MTRDERTIEDILERSLPSAPRKQMESALDRVFVRLRTDRGGVVEEVVVSTPEVVPSESFIVSRRRRWVPAVAAAAVIAAAIGTGILWPRGETSLYRVVDGTVQTGDTIQTNGGGAQLALVDGSRVEMRSQSELSLERADDGLRIRLSKGGIIVNAAEQRSGHLYVQTKDITVSVIGTVFLVNAGDDGSRVAVIEGEVRVQQGDSEKKLLPGEQVTTPPLEWQPMSEEIAWSRNVDVHIALLQQSSTVSSESTVAVAREAFEVVSVRPSPFPAGGGERGGGAGVRRRNPRPTGEPCGSSNEPVIDPRRFDASDTTVVALTLWAYGLDCTLDRGSDFLFGGPDWIKNDGFDVQAVIPEGTPSYTRDQLVAHSAPKLQAMLQTLLSDRFKLVLHRETKEMPAYVLTVAAGGPRYIASSRVKKPTVTQPGGRVVFAPGFGDPNPPRGMSIWREGDDTCCQSVGPGSIDGTKKSMAWLAKMLAWTTGRPVLDRTGLTGEFNYLVTFEPGRPMPPGFPVDTRSVFTAIEQDFGLKLEPSNEKFEVLVIDRVERPTEN